VSVQTTLFPFPVESPARLARRTDPDSSRQAAAAALAEGLVDEHSRRILNVLRISWGRELTSAEIAARAGLSVVQVCRRLGMTGRLRELRLVERIERRGERLRWVAL